MVENIDEEFEFTDNVNVPVGHYEFYGIEAMGMTPMTKKVYAELMFDGGRFYDGNQISIMVSPYMNLSSSVLISGTYRFDAINFEERNQEMRNHIAGFQIALYHVLRLFLGVVFVYASYDKILNPQAFAKAVYNYQILPDAAVNLVALTLPWLELVIGVCLVGGIWLPGATVVSSGLLIMFISALIFNQLRGLDIHCGCFSTEWKPGST